MRKCSVLPEDTKDRAGGVMKPAVFLMAICSVVATEEDAFCPVAHGQSDGHCGKVRIMVHVLIVADNVCGRV